MSTVSTYFRRFALIFLGILGCIATKAQQNWYLFIQSESSQAFYVRIGETIYASSPVGHLVINGLHDSTYRLAVGFPQTHTREQQFAVAVGQKDQGFELKQNDSRGWVLYNWLSGETIRSPRNDSLLYGERKKDDGFASLMAAVVKDSAVLYASIVKTEPPKKTEKAVVAEMKKPDTVVESEATTMSAVAAKDSLLNDQANRAELKDSVVQASPVKDSNVVVSSTQRSPQENTPPVAKLEEQTVNNEKKLIFLDVAAGSKKDTITVIIPLDKDSIRTEEKVAAKEEPVKDTAEEKSIAKQATEKDSTKANVDTAVVVNKEPEQTDTKRPKALMDSVAVIAPKDITEENKVDSAVLAAPKEPEPVKSSALVMMNSDCSKFASDHDVDKLRVKMLNEKDAGNRVFVAHKAFKSMCFSTKQIRALSELFPDDETRFRFFETAWPFVADTSNFKTLEGSLSDPFFVTRFRTLLKRQ